MFLSNGQQTTADSQGRYGFIFVPIGSYTIDVTDPASVARIYEAAGAAAISVLTEEDSFAGSLDDLRATRQATSLAILRKDFIFDEFQLYESAAAGADALLLIVAALNDETLERLRRIDHHGGLDEGHGDYGDRSLRQRQGCPGKPRSQRTQPSLAHR